MQILNDLMFLCVLHSSIDHSLDLSPQLGAGHQFDVFNRFGVGVPTHDAEGFRTLLRQGRAGHTSCTGGAAVKASTELLGSGMPSNLG